MRSIDLLNWDDLRVFIDVARTANLTQSSRRLKIDHSTVSRRVAQLEAALGASVFERTRTGLKLTEIGERILRHAENVESAVIGIRSEAGNETTANGVVRLATMEGIASLYIAPRLPLLRQTAPDLRLELVTSPQVIHVARREADLFLSFFRPPGQGLVSEKIGEFMLDLYASPLYVAQRGAPKSKADLNDHDFVTYIDDFIQVDAVRWLRDIVDEVHSVFNSNSMIAQMNAAAAGLWLVLLPRFAIHDGSPLMRVLDGTVSTSREIWVNVHHDLQFAPRIKTIVNFLKRQISADMALGRL